MRPKDDEPGPVSDRGPFGSSWRAWAARRAKPTLARDLRVGIRGKVTGFAKPIGPVLVAPFTKRPCVFWCAEIASRVEAPAKGLARLTGRKRLEWQIDMRDASTDRYWIIDEMGGHTVIDPKNAVVDVRREQVDIPAKIDDELGAFLLKNGFTPRLLGKETEFSMFEAIVAPSSLAGAWGIVTDVLDQVALGYRDASVVVRRIASTRIDRAVVFGG